MYQVGAAPVKPNQKSQDDLITIIIRRGRVKYRLRLGTESKRMTDGCVQSKDKVTVINYKILPVLTHL